MDLEQKQIRMLMDLRQYIINGIGFLELSRRTGLGRESLYKAFCADGNPHLHVLLKVFSALDLSFYIEFQPGRSKREDSNKCHQNMNCCDECCHVCDKCKIQPTCDVCDFGGVKILGMRCSEHYGKWKS